jgi:1-acyl-sn-glycerol-3-phosphate acyltransferase
VNCIKRKKLFSKEFKPFTRKHGEKRPAAITLGRIVRSLYGLAHFIFWSIFVFKPYSYLYFHIGKESDAKKLRFHKSLQRISRFFAKYIPGSGTIYENPSNETFDKPALIICNHQSLLDLPVIMSVNPKLILLTNDWVWNNKFFGNIVHYADFLPVSAGMDVILPRLRMLKDKGYSIVVFPEGTRSNDCVIQRFHQGAFLLAQELKLDVVPMVLHGAGNYLAKSDFMFRKGKITLRILPRIAYNTYGDLLLRKQASTFRKIICNEFDTMISNIETPEFFKSLVLYKYAYRGWKTVSTCKMLLKKMHEFEQQLCIENGNNSKTYFINSGIGVIPLLYALSHKEIEVYGYEENIQNFKIACETSDLPKNLHFKHVVFNSDYNDLPADANMFIIDDGKVARKFNGRKTTIIHIEP